MHATRSRAVFLCSILTLALAPAAHAWLFGTSWPELTEAQKAVEVPRIDPEAGAEILLREIKVDDVAIGQRSTRYFYRVKVFDERGVEEFSHIELESWGDDHVRRVYARVIHPDGRIEELERKTIYNREIFRSGQFRGKRVSFALPGVTPGCIVDFKYAIETRFRGEDFMLFTQSKMPTHKLSFEMELNTYLRSGVTFQAITSDQVTAKTGKFEVSLRDIPAYKSAPYDPPRSMTEPWLMFYYTSPDIRGDLTEKYWPYLSKLLYRWKQDDVQWRHRLIKAKAAELTAHLASPEDKLRAIYDFCVHDIDHLGTDRSSYSSNEASELKEADKPVEVLKFGYGYGYPIKLLFASLVKAAGFEMELALCNDRSITRFDPKMTYYSAVPDLLIAVRVEGEIDWRFFDPALSHVPFGWLHWTNEGTTAVIGNRREAVLIETPTTGPEESTITRKAVLNLNPDGSLEGQMLFEYRGHQAMLKRYRLDDLDEEEQMEDWEEELEDLWTEVDLSGYAIRGLDNAEIPLLLRADIRVPHFAEKLGSRLLIEPTLFARGEEALFPDKERTVAIVFPFRWQEIDQILINLPENFALDDPTAPAGVITQEYLTHEVTMKYDAEKHALTLYRNFHVGTYGFFPDAYPSVKTIFDGIHTQNNHLMMLKEVEPNETDATKATDGGEAEPSADSAPEAA